MLRNGVDFMVYPYLFQTCGFANIDAIRAELESQREWDRAESVEDSDQIQRIAALRYGFKAPFSPEQTALAHFLTRAKAGPHISTYAWGLYAQGTSAMTENRQFA